MVKKSIGKRGITTGADLDKVAKKLFGKSYRGIFLIESEEDRERVPELKNGELAILNTNEHWYAIFKKGGKLYESDSYGMDRMGRKYKNKYPPKSFIQGAAGKDQMDCGQRAITNLIYK